MAILRRAHATSADAAILRIKSARQSQFGRHREGSIRGSHDGDLARAEALGNLVSGDLASAEALGNLVSGDLASAEALDSLGSGGVENNRALGMARASVVLAVVAALLLRLPGDGFPPGLYRDEAWYGLDALRTLLDGPQLWYSANNGREPLFIWLVTPFIALLGPTLAAVRLPAALAGAIATAAIYPIGAAIAGRRAGAYASWLMAVLPWAVILGRTGLRASLLPAALLLAVAALLRASGRQGTRPIALAGALAGLTMYTYTAARTLPLLALAAALFLWAETSRRGRSVPTMPASRGGLPSAGSRRTLPSTGSRRSSLSVDARQTLLVADQWPTSRRAGTRRSQSDGPPQRSRLSRTMAIWLVGAMMTSAPLLMTLVNTPGGLIGRASQVSILRDTPPAGAVDESGQSSDQQGRALLIRPVLESAAAAAGLSIVRGDSIPRHNIVTRPAGRSSTPGDPTSYDTTPGDSTTIGSNLSRPPSNLPPSGRPAFGLPAAILWVLGIVWTVLISLGRAGRRRLYARTLLAAICVTLLPTALAEDAPHFLRAAGALPIGILVAAVGAGVLGRFFEASVGRSGVRGWPTASAITAVLLAITIFVELIASGRHIFFTSSSDEQVYFAFEGAATDLARAVNTDLGVGWRGGWTGRATENDLGEAPAVWLDRRLRDGWPAIPFLVPIERLTLIDPYDPILIRPGVAYVAPADLDLDQLWSQLAPDTRLVLSAGSPERGDLAESARTMWLRVGALPATSSELPAQTSAHGLRFVEAETDIDDAADADEDTVVSVSTRWIRDGNIPEGLTLFVHVREPKGQLAGSDAPLGFGIYPVERWEMGRDVTEIRTLVVPGGLDAAHDRIYVGMYLWPSTEPLQLYDADGEPLDSEILVWPETLAR